MTSVLSPVGTAQPRSMRFGLFVTAAGSAVVTVLITFAGITWYFGSWETGIRFIGGERLIVANGSRDLGIVRKGEHRDLVFRITNRADRAVRILGSHSECTCTVVTSGLPRTIESGETARIKVRFEAEGPGRRFSETVTLFTDLPSKRTVGLRIRGAVVESRGGYISALRSSLKCSVDQLRTFSGGVGQIPSFLHGDKPRRLGGSLTSSFIPPIN